MNRVALLLPILSFAACVSPADNGETDAADAAAESAPAQDALGKADAPLTIAGTAYEMVSPSTYRAGDITNLELLPAPIKPGVPDPQTYVRGRCYHAGCSTWATETNHYDWVKSSGHNYVRFWSFTKDASGNETAKVADTYEVKKTSTGIKLRKTYTSRWISLDARTDQQLCGESGGTWTTSCDCGPQYTPDGKDYNMMISGLGGCVATPIGSEDSCDSTGGDYTDDDVSAIGTYCICPLGTMVTETGCQAI